ncbi:hypothetical protein D9M69_532330 [compost metagenome]
MLGHQQVFHHRHFLEQADVLEGARQARAVHQVGAAEHLVVQAAGELRRVDEVGRVEGLAQHLDDVRGGATGVEVDAPAGGLVEAGQAVEHGGLAGAVGADQRGDGAALDLQADVVERLDATEVHHQVLDAEDVFVAHGATPLRGVKPARLMRISPRGRQIIISTMRMPKSSTR